MLQVGLDEAHDSLAKSLVIKAQEIGMIPGKNVMKMMKMIMIVIMMKIMIVIIIMIVIMMMMVIFMIIIMMCFPT